MSLSVLGSAMRSPLAELFSNRGDHNKVGWRLAVGSVPSCPLPVASCRLPTGSRRRPLQIADRSAYDAVFALACHPEPPESRPAGRRTVEGSPAETRGW